MRYGLIDTSRMHISFVWIILHPNKLKRKHTPIWPFFWCKLLDHTSWQLDHCYFLLTKCVLLLFRVPRRHRKCTGNDTTKVPSKSLPECDPGTSLFPAFCANIPTDPRKHAASAGWGSQQWCNLVKPNVTCTFLCAASYTPDISCTPSVECVHELMLQRTHSTCTSNTNTR